MKKSSSGPKKRKDAALLPRLWFLGGIVLPLCLLIFESTTHFCAKHFFDPFPSNGHVLLFLLIPASNLMVWLSQHKDSSPHYGTLALTSGMAAGIGIMYAFMFLPIMGLSLLFTLCGIGLLGLAPALSLPCTIYSGKILSKLALAGNTYFDPHQVKHIGHLLILVMVISLELPSTLTRINLSLADNPKTSLSGINWLRQFGNQEVMLRACYERSGRATDIVGSLYECTRPLPIDHARSIFYKVTGKPFNSVPIPTSARSTIQHAGLARDIAGVNESVQDEFDLDSEIAGELVSGISRGLLLKEKQIQPHIDADAGLANYQWSCTFINNSKYDREARFKLLLPAKAVLTAASLTVNGKEREARILLREKARTVYVQQVKRRTQNPLLVSQCAADEMLVQCFPVKTGQAVKVNLSLASPLELSADKGTALLGLPLIIEKNFEDLSDDAAGAATAADAGAGAIKSNSIKTSRDKTCKIAFTPDSFRPGQFIAYKIQSEQNPLPKSLTVIVDGSAGMKESIKEIVAGLRELPASIFVDLIVQADQKQLLCTHKSSSEKEFAQALQALDSMPMPGGQSDTVTVTEALKKSQSGEDAAVLWVHAAQPLPASKDLIAPFLKSASLRLYDFPVTAAPNELLEGLYSPSLVRVSRLESISADLKRLYASWVPNKEVNAEPEPEQQDQFTALPECEAPETFRDGSKQGPASLAQIYAYQRILNCIYGNAPGDQNARRDEISSRDENVRPDQNARPAANDAAADEAKELARDYHLVSPVSSAVVLNENPSREEKVATAVSPEPETWLLLLIAFAFMAAIYLKQKKEAFAK